MRGWQRWTQRLRMLFKLDDMNLGDLSAGHSPYN